MLIRDQFCCNFFLYPDQNNKLYPREGHQNSNQFSIFSESPLQIILDGIGFMKTKEYQVYGYLEQPNPRCLPWVAVVCLELISSYTLPYYFALIEF